MDANEPINQSDLSNVASTGPYDSLRDFIVALESHGYLVRIPEIDQDQYEATALAYRLIDRKGYNTAPAMLFDRVKVDGEWLDGPVLSNPYGPWQAEALGLGVENITDDYIAMYRQAMEKVEAICKRGVPKIDPNVIDNTMSPCKENVQHGDEVNILKFPWLKTNPADGGRYINSGSVIIEDSELGRNVGTYRCQVKGRNKIGVNPEPFQHGWNMLMNAKKRGEKSVKAAVVVGADPLVFAMSSSKVAQSGQDELAIAGGFRGKAVDVVRCETSDILVPAHAEIIIEGEIPLDCDLEEEGPFGEMYGYLGLKKEENFFMNIQAVTHRNKPWVINNYTGVMRGALTSPMSATAQIRYKMMVPGLQAMHIPTDATGYTIISIDKKQAGAGIAAGHIVAGSFNIAKVVIVVDKDVDVLNWTDVLAAVGSRWQPHPGTQIIPQITGMRLDPSQSVRGMTSKVVIDATRQLPEEGGPESYPPLNRSLLQDMCPEAFDLVDSKWDDYGI
ncbi:MAG: UbiD family decarboxylase [Rhodospirillaceae bacterium]